MSSNLQRLGETLSNRMKSTSAAAVPTSIELGTVNGNLSITADSMPTTPIPRGEYMVNLMLTGSARTSSESHTHSGGSHEGHSEGDGEHTHSGGSHSHEMPSGYRGLRSGDRILIAWCGTEPVVIAIVTSS